ncbi:MAG: histone deacetylase [Gemmatimonadetes bacterium]|nr:histone deacetylase [Gemmatimonadota bacterium]
MALRVVWSPRYEVDIGAHVFPTAKYRLVRDRLVEAGVVGPDAFVEPEPAPDADLLRVHTSGYLRTIADDAFTPGERARLEVPFTPALADAMRLCCGGTVLACRLALEDGVACHLGGGFHHAFAGHGEGFCLFNDVAVAAAALLDEPAVARVAVVDLDVHHGNGTAAMFAAEERVFTFSMHDEANYPAVKPPSDLDVGLARGTGDEAYLARLDAALPEVLDGFRPDLVLYLAGADPYRQDQLGGLSLTMGGLRRRDRMVLRGCRERGIPVATVPAGGYAVRTGDTVAVHAATVEEAVAAI